MLKRSGLGLFAVLTLALAAGSSPARADKPVPPPPRYYVLDEPGVLDRRLLHGLQSLLVEHDRLTSEQFVIAIMNSVGDEDPVAYTSRVFQQWKVGRHGKDNGVLLALYWKEHQARIEVGYGLEPLLTDAKSKEVISTVLVPELRAGSPDRALGLAALEILKILESPLIQSGKAQEILRGGGFHGSWHAARNSAGPGPWQVWIVFGIILAIIAFNMLSSSEAHYTSAGWYRPNPWKGRRAYGGLVGGIIGGLGGGLGGGRGGGGDWGGFGGGGGGGGGFLGGGGSSGGGGASGSW